MRGVNRPSKEFRDPTASPDDLVGVFHADKKREIRSRSFQSSPESDKKRGRYVTTNRIRGSMLRNVRRAASRYQP